MGLFIPAHVQLLSSTKTLIRKGRVNEEVLHNLIKEAYNAEDLYAECKLLLAKEENFFYPRKKYFLASYKELWDCYRNLTGKEDYLPYDKKHVFSLGKAFVLKKILEDELEMIEVLINF